MAIIRTNKYLYQVPSLTEDPTPGSSNMYFQLDAFDKTTLAYQMDSALLLNPASYLPITFGNSASNVTETPGALGGILMLKGEVTHCRHTQYNTQSVVGDNIDQAPWASMDPTRPIVQSRSDTQGSNTHTMLSYNFIPGTAANTTYYVRRVGTGDYSSSPPLTSSNVTAAHCVFPLFLNTSTGNIVLYDAAHTTAGPGTAQGAAFTGTFGTFTFQFVGNVQGTKSMQFVGTGNDGYAVFMHMDVGNDYTQNFYRYNDSNNTATLLVSHTASPAANAAANGHAGGTKVAGTGGNFCVKFASRTFTNPNTSKPAFYTPYFDSNAKYCPQYFEWDKSGSTFTRNTNTTVAYATGTQATYWTHDLVSVATASTIYNMERAYVNESFTSGGTRYVTLMYLHGAGGVLDAAPLQRTFVTYSVDSANYTALSYHSSVVIPQTPKNIVWLNDDRTLMGVFAHTSFYIYNFSSGWNLTATFPYQFNAVGRDSLGRIWAQDSGPFNYGRVHLLSGSVPTTVSVVPAQSTYTYAGTTINSTIALNAYDATGARMVANVTLTAGSTALKFVSDGNQVSTITVATSASVDTTVNIAVIGAGSTSITTSVVF
jgi:hypothetical protein